MKKLNRAAKYTIFICIGLTIFNIIFGYVLSVVAVRAMRTQINERMLDISNTAAAMLNGDELARITADDYGSPEYENVMKTLTYFQDKVKQLQYIIVAFLSFAFVCSTMLAIMITSQYNNLFVTLISKMNDLSNGIQTLINVHFIRHTKIEEETEISLWAKEIWDKNRKSAKSSSIDGFDAGFLLQPNG